MDPNLKNIIEKINVVEIATLDLTANFDTVTTWVYTFEDHRHNINQDQLTILCEKINTKLLAASLMPATETDLSNVKNTMNFVMSNKAFFSIDEVMLVLGPQAKSELMAAIYVPSVAENLNNNLANQIKDLKVQLTNFEKQANQVDILQAQIKKIQSQQTQPTQVSSQPLHKNVLRVRSDSYTGGYNQAPNTQDFCTSLHNDSFNFNSNVNSSNRPCTPPPPQAPPHAPHLNSPRFNNNHQINIDPNSSVNEQIAALTQMMGQFMSKKPDRPLRSRPISTHPSLWIQSKHGSLREYTENIYNMWARDQTLNEEESSMFFSYAFEKQIHRTHINWLVKKDDGTARYKTLAPLIDQIIQDLHLNEESQDDIQTNWHNFKVCGKRQMDEEFLRCFQLRKLGWQSQESHAVSIAYTKQKFVKKLNMASLLHSYVTNLSITNIWTDATNYYEVSIMLRDIENRFYGSKTSVGSNNNNQPTKMECNSIACVPCHADQSSMPNQNENQNFNNISNKTCKNPKCGKPFRPAKPKFVCCNMDCFKAWKESEGKPYTPYRKKKTNNNIDLPAANQAAAPAHAPAPTYAPAQIPPTATHTMNNIQACIAQHTTANNVSTTDPTYVTPAHLFSPGCDVPFVAHNSLYDSGATPTLMTVDCMKRANLAHLLTVPKGKDGTFGGDGEPMIGYRGYVTVEMCVEDSIGYITDKFKKKILVFDCLNHDFIVGHDSMKIGTRWSNLYPTLEKVLINATIRMTRKFNQMVIDQERQRSRVNNVSSEGDLSVPQMFSDASTFFLNVPCSTFNNVALEKYLPIIQKFTENFMNVAECFDNKLKSVNSIRSVNSVENEPQLDEETDSPLTNVLTEGGLDGTLDNRNIKVSDTKELITSKGTIVVGGQLSDAMTKTFKNYIENYKGDVFDNKTLGKTKQTCNPELKPDAKPLSTTSKYMPLNTFMKSEAGTLVQKMVDLGVLTECTDTANSTIFIVQKTSGKWRLICDLRRYNERLADFVVHLPSPWELINKICQFELFTYVDFPEAYFNVPMSEESIKSNPIVASVSGQQKNYKFLRMAQGLRPATAMFVNILNEIYASVSHFVFNYLDDSVIGSTDDEDKHFIQLKKFIQLTQDAGLKLSLKKSVFFAKDLTFLNYTVANGSWGLSDNQRQTINALNSDNLTQQKRESLAAFIQHFNKFHTGVAFASRKIRDPSTSPDSVKSYLDNIKKKLIASPALRSVNFEDDLHIWTDASSFDCSGVIMQKTKSGWQLVSCFSRKFPASVANKNIYEKELWTLQQVSKTFRYLFLGKHRKTFHMDNAAVLAAQKSKAPSLNCLFNTIESTFSNVFFKFTPTSKNASDCFTRLQVDNISMPPSFKEKILKIHCNAGCTPAERILETLRGFEEYKLITKKDVEDVLIDCPNCKLIENHKMPRKSSPGITVAREKTVQETIFIDHKQVINQHRSKTISLNNLDDPTVTNIETQKQSILTVFEPVSKLVLFYPVKSYSADHVKEALRSYIMWNGPPANVVSDNALSFVALGKWLEREYSSKLHCTSAYHPNSNLSERAHKEFEKVITIYNSETQTYNFENWRDALSRACVTINSLRHHLHEMSPYEIYKNRVQSDIEPVRFHQVGVEHRVSLDRFKEKVEKIVKSRLKVVLPIYKKGDAIKVVFPDQLPRFGVVTSTADHQYKMAVQVRFNKDRPVSVSKNYICVPRITNVATTELESTVSPTEIQNTATQQSTPENSVEINDNAASSSSTVDSNPFAMFPESSNLSDNVPVQSGTTEVDARTARRNKRNAQI